MDNDNYEITANGDASSVIFGEDNGLTLADLKGVTDITDESWTLLMNQITLEDCMIRTGFGGTSTKAIDSIGSPEVIQNDGPNGIYSYTLGTYASAEGSGDPYTVSEDDPNYNYKAGVMVNETVIGQTFSKELAQAYGEVMGNYSLWSNLTIWWGVGVNIHRSPYNARNHEYYSEDAVLCEYQAAYTVRGALKYGCLAALKHYALNDTEINRTGVAVYTTEQAARENELRCYQSSIEDEGCLALMTAFNRVGCYTANSHTGLMVNILREEWGFLGLISEDFIQTSNYSVLKEAVINGVTMTCNTGESTMAAVSAMWDYWTVDNVSEDETMLTALKQAMTWQAYAIANSNAMDGYSSTSRVVSVRTWYDNLITCLQIGFGVLTALCILKYVLALRKKNA